MALTANKLLSYSAYLELERQTGEKHGYVDGLVWAMAGGSLRHAAVMTNLTGQLYALLAGRPCRPYNSELKVRVPATGLATYPDLTIICGPPARHPEDRQAATNPTVLFEVLSPSTEADDRGEKFAHYRELSSLQHYLLVSVHQARVEHFRRQSDGSWRLTVHGGADEVDLDAVGVRLPVAPLYLDLPDDDDDEAIAGYIPAG